MDTWTKVLSRFRKDSRSNTELARLTGIARTTIRDLRTNEHQYPTLPHMQRIAALYAQPR